MTTRPSQYRPPFALDAIYYCASIAFAFYMFHYYWTGNGGPTLLAMAMIPTTFALFTLQSLRSNDLYPKLPIAANYVIATAYCGFALYCAYYMQTNYIALGTERSGILGSCRPDVGGVMTLLIMEYARKRHMPLFILNIVLVLYAVYGYVCAGHVLSRGPVLGPARLGKQRRIGDGIFSRLPQIALTVIGSFLLVLSLLRGFGCVDSLLRRDQARGIALRHMRFRNRQ